MSDLPLIRAYLDDLALALGAGYPELERVLAETEDHLVEMVDSLRSAGMAEEEAQRAALIRFGPAREVALRFASEARPCAKEMARFRAVAPLGVASAALLIAAGLVLVGNRGAEGGVGGERNDSANSNSRPFTAVKLVTVYDDSGGIHSVSTVLEAFRGDGSRFHTSRLHTSDVAKERRYSELRSVEDRTNGIRAMILPALRLVSSYPIANEKFWKAWTYPQPTMCSYLLEALETDPRAERGVMLGHEVVKHNFGPGGRHERWVAPGLDCYEMFSTTWRTDPDTGERRLAGTGEAVFVIEGEPPTSYFEVPDDFRESPPSEIFRSVESAWSVKASTQSGQARKQFYAQADASYYRRRGTLE